jgi:hypothetical protein
MQSQRTKWWKIAGAGYLVLLVFGAGYFATKFFGAGLGEDIQITVGVLLAAPLAIGFLWDRLKAVKVLGTGIELSEVTANVALANSALEDAITAHQYYSGKEAILAQVVKAVEVPDKQVLEINLRSQRYWWSTRLYLQAALLMDHSPVSHVVFVEGDDLRHFVGITRTQTLRQALAETLPCMETIYRNLTTQNLSADNLIKKWAGEQLFDEKNEDEAKSLIDSQKLREILGDRLEVTSVEHSDKLDHKLYSQILKHGGQFVPVVKAGRLERIVDADALARRLALKALS